jgi:crotonobetainyl-CoA:carnitine CoA-transferase CaiB-like acyl-CoA transferase
VNSNLRRKEADFINAQVTSFTMRYLKEDLAELMQKHGIPGLPVNSPSDFMKDPHIQARGFFSPVSHPVLGSFDAPGSFYTVDGKRAGPAASPLVGQHNHEILCGELGLNANDLAAEGII